MEHLHLPQECLLPCEAVDNTPPLLDTFPSALSPRHGQSLV